MQKEFYEIREVAAMLGVHHKTVRSWIEQGKLPATKVGKLYRIRRTDFEAFTNQDGESQRPSRARTPSPADKLDQIVKKLDSLRYEIDDLQDELKGVQRQVG